MEKLISAQFSKSGWKKRKNHPTSPDEGGSYVELLHPCPYCDHSNYHEPNTDNIFATVCEVKICENTECRGKYKIKYEVTVIYNIKKIDYK